MARKKLISDEQIISALMTSKTYSQAAEKLGISTRNLQDRMKSEDFQRLYKAEKTALLRRTTANLAKLSDLAIQSYYDIMREGSDRDKISAADSALKHMSTFFQMLDSSESKGAEFSELNLDFSSLF